MSDCVNSSVGCNGSTTIVGCDGSDIEACLDNILAQANQVCDACFSVETRLSKVRAILVNMSQFIEDYNTNHNHSASQITSGTLDNARVNWASPSAIGGTTPANGTFNNIYLDMTASYRQVVYKNSGVDRFQIRCSGTETGSNTGSDLFFLARDDAGTGVIVGLKITRATGVLTALPTYSNAITTSVRDLQIDSSGNLGYVVSARKHKHKIRPIKETNRFIAKLRKLNPVRYRYKVDGDGDGVVDDLLTHYGFVAEEVEEVFPELCSYDIVPDEGAEIIRDERGKLDPSVPTHKEIATLNYSEMHAIAIAGLQHALDKIDELETKVARLEKIIDRLDGGK